MAEVWLRTNRRALALGIVLPGLVAIAALGGLAWVLLPGRNWWLGLLPVALLAASLWMVGELLYAISRPRLALEGRELLVYLEPTRPTRVPIEIVECFFVGQGPSELPKLKGRNPQSRNVIVRLADSATEWKDRDVRPAFGQWCGGYITIRGNWCEPITPAIMQRLNQQLAEAQRGQKASSQQEAAS
jgi:hypothetical protein